MAYYIIYNNTEIYIAENEQALVNFYPGYKVHELPADYNSEKYQVVNGELVLNPDYDQQQAALREAAFKSEFFQITNFGWYRKKPKGYTSALESLTVAYNMVTSGVIQELPAGTFIFYEEPDFTKPEECTEEWLVEHQILSQAMNAQQFLQLYAAFVVAWNTEMHESEAL